MTSDVATLLLALLVVLATSNPPCVLPVSFLISNSSICNLSLPLLYLIEEPEVIFTSYPDACSVVVLKDQYPFESVVLALPTVVDVSA